MAKWGEPKWAGNTIYNTIQVAMETVFFFIAQISVSLKKFPLYFGDPNQQFMTHQKMSLGAGCN